MQAVRDSDAGISPLVMLLAPYATMCAWLVKLDKSCFVCPYVEVGWQLLRGTSVLRRKINNNAFKKTLSASKRPKTPHRKTFFLCVRACPTNKPCERAGSL